jgi:protein-disulfide isomerase
MSTSLRKEMKDKRRKERQKQRQMATLAIIIGGAILVGLIFLSGYLKSSAPVGDFTVITPDVHPQVNGTTMGDPNAPVRIDVFEDFQCPACQYYSENIEHQVIDNLITPGKVYYVFHNYPFLDDRAATKESDQAANASMCAADQGRFWDYHQMLYANWKGENEGNLSDKRLTAFAESLGFDMTKFNACFKANQFKDQINADLKLGQDMGAQGTPSLFVNNKIVAPGQVPTYEEIKAAVDAALNQ